MDIKKNSELLRAAGTVFDEALDRGVFPGAAISVFWRSENEENELFSGCYGYTEPFDKKIAVNDRIFYDLASLTKPLVTVLLLAVLLDKKKFNLTDCLSDLSVLEVPADKKKITIAQLMSHSSGFAAHYPYYVKLLGFDPPVRKERVIEWILNDQLVYKPGEKHLYSDLGFILLSHIVERVEGVSLGELFEKEISGPLELEKELFFPVLSNYPEDTVFAPTEVCPWSYRLLCGEVHDDNCRSLGGVAGHAGLFGTIGAVTTLCRYIMDIYNGNINNPLISQETLKQLVERRGNSTWACGFDMVSKLYSSSGKYFSPSSIGHLGYSGTSFWIDLEKRIGVVLLTNRVCPTRANEGIKRFRPKIHNVIMETLL